MKAMLEQSDEKRVPSGYAGQNDKKFVWPEHVPRGGRSFSPDEHGRWAQLWATVGAAAWAGLAVLARAGFARIGGIELMFLFAPLVVVPLGMELGSRLGASGGLAEVARRMQPLGAGLTVASMMLPVGRVAGLVAAGWLAVCVLTAGDGVATLISSSWQDTGRSARATRAALAIARVDLAVGGAWLVASRLGMRPMGIQEPIGLLTAVHFHYAGFATATIAAATLSWAEQDAPQRWLRLVVMAVLGLPFLVAAGFVISPVLKMIAGVLFSASVALLAFALLLGLKRFTHSTARLLLRVASGAVLAGMVFSGVYAIADFAGSDALPIPQMARTHGILNGVGFCLPGLLGWLIEGSAE